MNIDNKSPPQHTPGPWEYEEHPDGGFKIWGNIQRDKDGSVSHEVARTSSEDNALSS